MNNFLRISVAFGLLVAVASAATPKQVSVEVELAFGGGSTGSNNSQTTTPPSVRGTLSVGGVNGVLPTTGSTGTSTATPRGLMGKGELKLFVGARNTTVYPIKVTGGALDSMALNVVGTIKRQGKQNPFTLSIDRSTGVATLDVTVLATTTGGAATTSTTTGIGKMKVR